MKSRQTRFVSREYQRTNPLAASEVTGCEVCDGQIALLLTWANYGEYFWSGSACLYLGGREDQ